MLLEEDCIATNKSMAPLPSEEIVALLKEIPGWQLFDGNWLLRRYKLNDFAQALSFVNKVGEIAEKQGHHPDIELGWGYVTIKLQTHDVGGLHRNDFILAAKINKLA